MEAGSAGLQVLPVRDAGLVERIWARDASVWTGGDEAQWLGWLDEPLRMRERVGALLEFAGSVAGDGIDTVCLLGMGGSSLSPEVLRRSFCADGMSPVSSSASSFSSSVLPMCGSSVTRPWRASAITETDESRHGSSDVESSRGVHPDPAVPCRTSQNGRYSGGA